MAKEIVGEVRKLCEECIPDEIEYDDEEDSVGVICCERCSKERECFSIPVSSLYDVEVEDNDKLESGRYNL
jgi:hypothetical protein